MSTEKRGGNPGNTRYRAHLPVWLLFGGLSCLLWLVVWGSSSHGLDITGFAVALTVSGFILAWLLSFRIVLTETEVQFRSLFRGRESIRHDQIKKVRLTWSLRWRARGPMRLVIEPRDGSSGGELSVNAKVFSRAAIEAVLAVGARVADVDDGGLRDGVVLRAVRKWKQRRKP